MKKSIKKNKGFTLAELLVVVAIIGVLVAISIPIFTGQLEKARIATDKANVRAAKIAAVAEYLSSGATGAKSYYYDAGAGTVKDSPDNIKGYGKSTSTDTGAENTIPVSNGKANLVRVDVSDIYGEAPYKAYWEDGNGTSSSGDGSGGGSGGGSSDTSGGGSGGGSSDTSGDSSTGIIWDTSTAKQYPEKPCDLTVSMGERYVYNGIIYIAVSDRTFNQWDYRTPGSQEVDYLFRQPNGTIISASSVADPQNMTNLKTGDIYITSDGEKYIRVYGDGNGQAPTIDTDTSRWVKILN